MASEVHSSSTLDLRRRRAAIALAAPGFGLIWLTILVPLAVAVGLSLTRYDLINPPQFVGLDNYRSVLADDVFWTAVGNTVEFALGQVGIGIVVAMFVAVLFNRALHGGPLMRTLVYLPQGASYVVVALVWTLLFDPVAGPFSQLSEAVRGEPIHFLTDIDLAMPSIIAMSLWRNLGYFMIILLAALQAVPRELLEAAEVDGAGPVRRFAHVTLPQIRSATVFVLITWFLGALQMFTQAYVMTGGGPVNATRTIVYLMYQEAFSGLAFGKASAIAVLLFGTVAVVAGAARLVGYRQASARRSA
ncbi:binding-protein-dependent transport systems inner membrane component [Beutenbergia cavernae DSM 12333]|uniref:Binding-protein-dependent transport systems inner membrane component n=1 Tax=Beutenbergia cavernae (strain ATCC BAA-8 / DSM 12333 / CCUG 43141 / JCM 11478 / NBRC 16432 / NCIMB 13614 / HKI 0122) TaxID=471853 RepID=C5C584_BEUC1|nr:sugar ABC transporter permease [Beutenbergia cavernae]ACQ82224.1 binding-protein-dependent transport systems inner membrane component [Beutenbergia cavernae DSM 12333]